MKAFDEDSTRGVGWLEVWCNIVEDAVVVKSFTVERVIGVAVFNIIARDGCNGSEERYNWSDSKACR